MKTTDIKILPVKKSINGKLIESKKVSEERLVALKSLNDRMNQMKVNLGELAIAEEELKREKELILKDIQELSLKTKEAFKAMADDAGAKIDDGSNWEVNWQNKEMTRVN